MNDASMGLPRFSADDDGYYRFGPRLADWASLMVAMELETRSADRTTRDEQKTWAQLFNKTVRPRYEEPRTEEEMESLERELRRFVKHTAANHL